MTTNWTPGPWRAAVDMDGRHNRVSIMAYAPEFLAEEWPYHPLIAGAYHGRGQAPRAVCNANAQLIAAAPDLYNALLNFMALECTDMDNTKILLAAFDKGRTALAKARGETP